MWVFTAVHDVAIENWLLGSSTVAVRDFRLLITNNGERKEPSWWVSGTRIFVLGFVTGHIW
jgi:hypothetical protein